MKAVKVLASADELICSAVSPQQKACSPFFITMYMSVRPLSDLTHVQFIQYFLALRIEHHHGDPRFPANFFCSILFMEGNVW